MGADQLIDEHISSAQASKALKALHAHATKHAADRDASELLPTKDEHVWLVVGTKIMHPEKKLKPHRIPVKHPLVDPREASICLITKDPQREYKDLLADKNINFISRVVGIEKLKGKFRGFDARRALLNENGLFLADERVIPLLPKLLGSKFFQAKKQPIPVSLTNTQLKAELERAVSSTYFHQNKGTCTAVKLGPLSDSFGPPKLLDNLTVALPAVIAAIKGGWDNVQNLHIKTSTSASLPIWTCDLGTGSGGRWDGLTVAVESDEVAADARTEKVVGKKRSQRDEDEDDAQNDQAAAPKGKSTSKGKGKVAEPSTTRSKASSKASDKPPATAKVAVAADAPPKKKRKHDTDEPAVTTGSKQEKPSKSSSSAPTSEKPAKSTKQVSAAPVSQAPKKSSGASAAASSSDKPASAPAVASPALKSALKAPSTGTKPAAKKKATFAADVGTTPSELKTKRAVREGSSKRDKIVASGTRDKGRKKATLVASAKRR